MEEENKPDNNPADEDMEFDDGSTSSENEEEEKVPTSKQVYLPGAPMEEGAELVCDESAYHMYHQAQTGAPCLSFDVVPDHLGDNREHYPLTCYMVAGTQAEMSHVNFVITMKMSNLRRTAKDNEDDDDDDESDDDDDDEKPELETAMIKHPGTVNRIRSTVLGGKTIAATWSERGKVHVWDLTSPLQAVNSSAAMAEFSRDQKQKEPNALFTFAGHQVEGYGLDWSPLVPGRLATGDCNKNIHLWQPQEGGSWHVDQRPYTAHTASVEDIQWSPCEDNVFASCSVDKSIRIWDARAQPHKACMLTTEEAHTRDVNVISWNRKEPFIISGGDDGVIKIWDLRQFQQGKPVAMFKHHSAPITSIEWNMHDSTVFAASGSDDQLTIWDLAVERDAEEEGAGKAEDEPNVPPQLLFIHQGQTDLKELHWHAQLPGVIISTAHSGFNIFRTISV